MPRGQAEALIPMVEQVVAESGVTFGDLDLVAVTVGPGSFTGMRTGLAAARGIALARGIPVLGVTTLAAVAEAARRTAAATEENRAIVVALDSRRAAVYAQVFRADGMPAGEPFAALPQDVASGLPDGRVLLAGDAAAQVQDAVGAALLHRVTLVERVQLPDAVCVVDIAAAKWTGGNVTPVDLSAAPLYLSPPEAKQPAGGGRLRP